MRTPELYCSARCGQLNETTQDRRARLAGRARWGQMGSNEVGIQSVHLALRALRSLAEFFSILLGTGFGEQTIRLGAKLRWLADQQHRRVVLPALCVRLLNELATSLFKVVSCPEDDRQNIRIRKHLGEAVGA